MKSFISYSHKDEWALEMLHTHLAQLKRDNLISAWTDKLINAGTRLNPAIIRELENVQLFIALLSPDYIASQYCYEKEFQHALDLEKAQQLTVVPVILEPCDWLNTPFQEFKAVPKDGKPVKNFSNMNTAFLDIIQNLRTIIQAGTQAFSVAAGKPRTSSSATRNYRVKKDFDSIHKIEFVESTFQEVHKTLEEYIAEIITLDNIRVRTLAVNSSLLEWIMVNRNMIDKEANLKITRRSEGNMRGFSRSSEYQLTSTINEKSNSKENSFTVDADEYELFWTKTNFYGMSHDKERYTAKEIVDIIWQNWLESVGIM